MDTKISRDIKILAEVEKIWILYDIDSSGKIEKSECSLYLKQMAEPRMELKDEQIDEIFDLIDFDGNGDIDKFEMECFLKVIMMLQDNLSFKSSQTFFHHMYEKERIEAKQRDEELKKRYDL